MLQAVARVPLGKQPAGSGQIGRLERPDDNTRHTPDGTPDLPPVTRIYAAHSRTGSRFGCTARIL
jgi:hypothetical protein